MYDGIAGATLPKFIRAIWGIKLFGWKRVLEIGLETYVLEIKLNYCL